jgi:uncharacterized protein (TIGR02117 family)
MSSMKKFLKYTGRVLLTVVLLILVYFGCAWVFGHLPVSAEPDPRPEVTVFLESNGVHTDLVVPVRTVEKDWSLGIRYSDTRSGDSTLDWLAIGWGDKDFYLNTPTWADLKFSTVFKAVFGLSPSAIHATYCRQPAAGDRCIKLVISRGQYGRLVRFIENSFRQDSLGNPMVVQTTVRYDEHDAFYEAKGSYNAFHTCNTWANDALKAAGQRACWWTPLDRGILYQYRRR